MDTERQQPLDLGRNTLLVILLLLLALVLIRTAWVCDDAYITFRTIDNLAHGHGLTWNAGERVQVFTHPLWLVLVALLYPVTGEFYFTVLFLSIALTLLAAGLAVRHRLTFAAGLIGLTVLLFSRAFTDYATSGLENPLLYLILGLFGWLWYRREENLRTLTLLALAAALGALTRPDTILLFVPALFAVWLRLPKLRGLGALVVGFLPLLLWEVFSIIYYGFPLPNTFYAKLGAGIPLGGLMEQGFIYFLDSLHMDPLTLAVIFAVTILAAVSRERKAVLLMLGVVLYLLYVVRIGGDFMSGRFFAVPLFASVIVLMRLRLPDTPAVSVAGTVIVALVGLMAVTPPPLSGRDFAPATGVAIGKNGIADERAQYYEATGLLRLRHDRKAPAHDWCEEGARAAEIGVKVLRRGTVGFFGYCAGPDIYIIDPHALCDPLLARLPASNPGVWRPGHYLRGLPDGYKLSLEKNANELDDSRLADYYRRLMLVARGPLFSSERWKEIVRFNLGQNDHLLVNHMPPAS